MNHSTTFGLQNDKNRDETEFQNVWNVQNEKNRDESEFQNVWNEQKSKNRDESDETRSEYYDSSK